MAVPKKTKASQESTVTMKVTSDEVAALLDVTKDVLATLAEQVYKAMQDGKISWAEGLQLGVTGTASAAQLVTAFQQLSRAGAEELIDVLKNSDLVVK